MSDAMGPERVLATVLFTDLVGSTKLVSELGDERWHQLLDAHRAGVRRELGRFQGHEVQTIGDGFLATFDSPARAILCARAIAEAMTGLGLQIRAGVHTGETEIVGDDIRGIAVHIGARVAALAGPDEILVSSTVKDLVEGSHIQFTPRGSRVLKGVPGRWRLFAVKWKEEPPEQIALPRRPAYPLVGRAREFGTVEEIVGEAAGGNLRVLTLEGEAGIGKTRLLDETAEAVTKRGFSLVFVGADEEVGGGFYLARALIGSPALSSAASDAASKKALKAASGALAGKVDAVVRGLPAEDRMMHVFDAATVALRAVAARRPLAILLDDLQWADEDSIRLIRYFLRSDPNVPILLALAYRPEAARPGSSLSSLAVDAERLGIGRRTSLERLSFAEATELLHHLLGGPATPSCAEALFGQSEGVPFILEELVRSFRDTGQIHSIDGTWELARAQMRMVPSSVQSLIERKAMQLPAETREALADAAALGRRFALRDLAAVTRALKPEGAAGAAELATVLDPALHAGLLAELPEGSTHDYAFTHDQAREVLASAHGRPRRRLVHAAILEMVSGGGDPPEERLAEAAHHALAAGETERGVRYSIRAARLALVATAPDEALRVAERALEGASRPEDRLDLLRVVDDALEMLGRADERAETLEEFAKIAATLRDERVEFELMRRRAAAARSGGDHELAADLARLTREQAESRGDRHAQLAACLELGQALLRSPLGEAFNPAPTDVDLDGAEEAFSRALGLAEDLGEERLAAACRRELGVIYNSRAKDTAIEEYSPLIIGEGRFHLPPEEDPMWAPVDEMHARAKEYLEQALESFERLDDRAGVMSTVIALSYSHYHSGVKRGVAGVIEQIRKLRARLTAITTGGERHTDEAEMLYSVHVYARNFHYADLALERGRDAHRAARSIGYRWLEFVAAGGTALTHLEVGEPDEAEEWLDRARSAAMVTPSPLRARQLELWRGLARAEAGDVEDALRRLGRALELAREQRSRPGITEAVTSLALVGALLGSEANDEDLLGRAKRWAEDALALSQQLPGQHPWHTRALAATAQLHLAAGDAAAAADAALEAVSVMDLRFLEPVLLDVLLVAARSAAAAADPRWPALGERIRWDLHEIAARILDEDVRGRWLDAPLQRELRSLAGEPEPGEAGAGGRVARVLTEHEREILRRVARGMTNREIAGELEIDARAVGKDLANVFTKLGVRSRAAATTVALREGVA